MEFYKIIKKGNGWELRHGRREDAMAFDNYSEASEWMLDHWGSRWAGHVGYQNPGGDPGKAIVGSGGRWVFRSGNQQQSEA